MTIVEYKDAVITLFQSGRATDEQWREMANAVLWISESECGDETNAIDAAIEGAKEDR